MAKAESSEDVLNSIEGNILGEPKAKESKFLQIGLSAWVSLATVLIQK